MTCPSEPPWAAGLRAARANLLPGLLVQSVMLAALLLYYFHPPALGFFKFLARLKTDWGYGYSIVSSAIAGAVLPEILRIIAFQRGNFRCKNFNNLCFAVPFWSAMGLCVDLLYRSQATWFGADASFQIVLKKVLVDQFLYNPLFSAPVTTWLYHWKQTGYSSQAMNGFLSSAYYRERILPTLFATWGVWIPVVTILYSLPSLLQIPLFGLALTLWVILYTWMSEQETP